MHSSKRANQATGRQSSGIWQGGIANGLGLELIVCCCHRGQNELGTNGRRSLVLKDWVGQCGAGGQTRGEPLYGWHCEVLQ